MDPHADAKNIVYCLNLINAERDVVVPEKCVKCHQKWSVIGRAGKEIKYRLLLNCQ